MRIAILVLVICSLGAAQELPTIRQFTGGLGDFLGSGVAGLGDVDGDGCDDVCIGSPRFTTTAGISAGKAEVISGATGLVLFTVEGTAPNDQLGWDVYAAGDVDADGTPDFAANAPGRYVRIFSGATGAIHLTIPSTSSSDLGAAMAVVADVDGDGIRDLALGAPSESMGLVRNGSVRIYSAATGAVLYTLTGSAIDDHFGFALDASQDFDGDGAVDLLIGAPQFVPCCSFTLGGVNSVGTGYVAAYCGASFTPIFTISGFQFGENFGHAVTGFQDINGDGIPEIAVGAPWGFGFSPISAEGTLYVLDGSDGALVFSVLGSDIADRFGYRIVSTGDLDRDGSQDLVVSAPFADPQSISNADFGEVWLIQGNTGATLRLIKGDFASRSGSALAAAGDTNGDGFPDVIAGGFLFGNPVPFSTTANGRARILTLCGASEYGTGTGGLTTQWKPGLTNVPNGSVVAFGAGPFSVGAVAVSLQPDATTFGGVPLLVSSFPGDFVSLDWFGFSSLGEVTFPVSIAQPAYAGAKFYVQTFADNGTVTASQGLELLFCP